MMHVKRRKEELVASEGSLGKDSALTFRKMATGAT